MSPDLDTHQDRHGHVRVFWDGPKGRRLIGVVRHVRVGRRSQWYWLALASAVSEPYPTRYATKGEACEALKVIQVTRLGLAISYKSA